jgi:hypothetical protein
VPDLQSNISISNTTGSLGGQLTEGFVNVMYQISQQLAEEANVPGGTPDPNMVALINQLAAQSHNLGALETAIVDNCAATTPCNQAYPGNHASSSGFDSHNFTLVPGRIGNVQNAIAAIDGYAQSHPGSLPPDMMSALHNQAAQVLNIAGAFNTQIASSAGVDSWQLLYNINIPVQSPSQICPNCSRLL